MYCEKDNNVLDVVTISSGYVEHLMYYTTQAPNLKKNDWLEVYKDNFVNSFNLELSSEFIFPFSTFQKVLLALIDWTDFYTNNRPLLKQDYADDMVKHWLMKTLLSKYHTSNLIFEMKEDTITLFIKIETEYLSDILKLKDTTPLYYPLVQYTLENISGVPFYGIDHNFTNLAFVLEEMVTYKETPIDTLINTLFINLTYGVNELIKAKKGLDKTTIEKVLVNPRKKKYKSKRHYYLETPALLLGEPEYASDTIHEDLADIYVSVDALAQGMLKLEDIAPEVIRESLEGIYDKLPFTSFTVYQPQGEYDNTLTAQFKVLNTFLILHPRVMTLFLKELPKHPDIDFIINLFQTEYERLSAANKHLHKVMDSSKAHILHIIGQLAKEGNFAELLSGVLLGTDEDRARVIAILMSVLTGLLAEHKDLEMQFEEYLQNLAFSIQFTLKNDEVRMHLGTRGFDDTGFTIVYNLKRKNTNVLFTIIDKGSKQEITTEVLNSPEETGLDESILSLLHVVLVIHDYFNNPKIIQRLKQPKEDATPRVTTGKKSTPTNNPPRYVGKKIIYIKSEHDKVEEARHEAERADSVRKTFSWYQRGHFRHYKSGKVTYIREQIKGAKTDSVAEFKKGIYYIEVVDN